MNINLDLFTRLINTKSININRKRSFTLSKRGIRFLYADVIYRAANHQIYHMDVREQLFYHHPFYEHV